MGTAHFKILTLGTSGAGKTVFLASMFKQLFSQEDGQFSLKIESSAQRKQLNAIYTQLLNGEEWPEGTRGYSEWTFTCRVQAEDLNNYTACQFTYFDYAGGRLTDDELEPEFLDILDRADAILCLLDGHKIYKWLSDRESFRHKMPKWLSGKESPDVVNFLQKDLPAILNCIQMSNVPVQFVISKWDILEGQFELEEIRDHLLSIPHFKQVVQERCEAGAMVRLIPVSAVGSGYSRLERGEIKRIPGAIPMPQWVEIPVACVLPDRLNFQLHQTELNEQVLSKSDSNFVGVVGSILNSVGGGLEGLSWVAIHPLTGALLGGAAILSKQLGTFLQQEAEERREALEISLKQVTDEKSALSHAIKSFLNIQQGLLEIYPESEITLPSLMKASVESC